MYVWCSAGAGRVGIRNYYLCWIQRMGRWRPKTRKQPKQTQEDGTQCPAKVAIAVLACPYSGSQLLCGRDRKRATGSSRNLRHGTMRWKEPHRWHLATALVQSTTGSCSETLGSVNDSSEASSASACRAEWPCMTRCFPRHPLPLSTFQARASRPQQIQRNSLSMSLPCGLGWADRWGE